MCQSWIQSCLSLVQQTTHSQQVSAFLYAVATQQIERLGRFLHNDWRSNQVPDIQNPVPDQRSDEDNYMLSQIAQQNDQLLAYQNAAQQSDEDDNMLLQIVQQNDQLLAYQNAATVQQSEEACNTLLQVNQQPNQAY